MGGWWLAGAAAGFWAGALVAGLGDRGPGTGGALLLLCLGSASLVSVLALGMRLPRTWLPVVAVCAIVSFSGLGCAAPGGVRVVPTPSRLHGNVPGGRSDVRRLAAKPARHRGPIRPFDTSPIAPARVPRPRGRASDGARPG